MTFGGLGRKLLSSNDWIRRTVSSCVAFYESKYGPVYARRSHRSALRSPRSMATGLETIASRWPEVGSSLQDNPIFILSAGWRSGSTLLQRLVMTGQSVLIWGEPYSHARVFHYLSRVVTAITEEWPHNEWFIDNYDLDELNASFTANMYPQIQDLLNACQSYTKTLLEEPAKRRGYQRWGLKDVRLTIDDARFLRWLFPNASIVFLCRNPYAAYRSYRLDRSWYYEWPNHPVFTADSFGRCWQNLAEGFWSGWREVDGLFLRYEDLHAGSDAIKHLEDYLQMDLDAGLLERKIGTHRHENDAMSWTEYLMLKKEVAGMSQMLGYKNERNVP